MNWDAEFLRKPDAESMDEEEIDACLENADRVWVKKRMVGKFIGFSWCGTPRAEVERKVKWLGDVVGIRVRRERECRGRLEDKGLGRMGRGAL